MVVPVSAVIPCYRCANTIERAVVSVLAQTAAPAEVFLVDDHSGDETLSELQRLAERYGAGRIHVIALSENGGPGAARNAGWEAARQSLIAFLDADDAWHPKKLETQYEWMRKHPEVALCGHDSRLARSAEDCTRMPAAPVAHRIESRQLLVSNRFPTRSVMLRRDLPFRFRLGKDHAEDYLLWLEILLSGHQGWRLESVLAFCFKAEYSSGGYSGDLWVQERRELNTLRLIWQRRCISRSVFVLAAAWSLGKHLRRKLLRWGRSWRLKTDDSAYRKTGME